MTHQQRPPLPPFTRDTAIEKVRLAEDSWNSRNLERVVLAYTPDRRVATGFMLRRHSGTASPFARRSVSIRLVN